MLDTFVIEQIQTFALTVGLGLMIGFCYDLIRAVRAYKRFSRGTQFFLDLIFWLLMTLAVFVALLASNWGEVRAYVFIGLITGGIVYTVAFSRFIHSLMVKALGALIGLVCFLARPVIWMAGKAKLFLQKVRKGIDAVSTRLEKITAALPRKKKE